MIKTSVSYGLAPEMGAAQRVIVQTPDGVVRIEAKISPDATALVYTYQSADADETDQRVAAASAGISVSPSTKDHPEARREISRATETDWEAAEIVIDGEPQPAKVFQLLSGVWIGYVQHEGAGIALGSSLDLRQVRLATVRPEDLAEE